jgi:hypothetical protein
MRNGDDTVDQRIVNALQKKEDLSKRINKDDLKFLTGNFKKKDKEAFKDIEIIEDPITPDAEEEGIIQTTEEPNIILNRDLDVQSDTKPNNSDGTEQPLLF